MVPWSLDQANYFTIPSRYALCNDDSSCDQNSVARMTIFILFQCMARLNNRCHPDELRDFVEHGGHDPEEFPFLEEQSVLRRLEATLFSLRNWSMTKSKAALNNWHVRDFVLITQGDLLNAQDCYKLLQVIIER